jgi:membrane protease YdiL (CAAX protease family)
MPMDKPRAVGLYLLGAFGLVTVLAGGFALAGARYEGKAAVALGVAAMLAPALSAALVTRLGWRAPLRPVLALHLRPNRWFFVAWALPLGTAALSLGLASLLPGVSVTGGMEGFVERLAGQLDAAQRAALEAELRDAPLPLPLLVVAQAAFAGLTVNALAALGEEAGWRGYLHAVLEERFWPAALLTGLVWGLWHAPLVALGHNRIVGDTASDLTLTVAWCVLAAPLHTYIRARSGSAVAAAVLHGTFNATAGVPLLFLRGGDPLWVGPLGLCSLGALALANLALAAVDRAGLGSAALMAPGSRYRTGPTAAPRPIAEPPGSQAV